MFRVSGRSFPIFDGDHLNAGRTMNSGLTLDQANTIHIFTRIQHRDHAKRRLGHGIAFLSKMTCEILQHSSRPPTVATDQTNASCNTASKII